MTPIRLLPALAAVALLVAVPLAAGDASAKTSSFMTDCSAKWKTAKANGTVPSGMKWPDFMKTMCDHSATDTGAATTTDGASSTDSSTSTGTTTSGGDTTTAAAPGSTGGTFMEQCSAAWKQMKANNSVPAGLTWPAFVKQKCVTNAKTDSASYTPPEPQQPTATTAVKPVQNWRSIAVAKADKNGKPFSQGQIEAHQRIKECAAEWHAAKAGNSLPAGTKWPQFWSTCNTRLKAQN